VFFFVLAIESRESGLQDKDPTGNKNEKKTKLPGKETNVEECGKVNSEKVKTDWGTYRSVYDFFPFAFFKRESTPELKSIITLQVLIGACCVSKENKKLKSGKKRGG